MVDLAFVVLDTRREPLFAQLDDAPAHSLGPDEVRDRVWSSCRHARADVEHKSVVDAIVVVTFQVESLAVGTDRLIEILGLAVQFPQPFMKGTPEAEGFGVVG